jgi:hypothetical protein
VRSVSAVRGSLKKLRAAFAPAEFVAANLGQAFRNKKFVAERVRF